MRSRERTMDCFPFLISFVFLWHFKIPSSGSGQFDALKTAVSRSINSDTPDWKKRKKQRKLIKEKVKIDCIYLLILLVNDGRKMSLLAATQCLSLVLSCFWFFFCFWKRKEKMCCVDKSVITNEKPRADNSHTLPSFQLVRFSVDAWRTFAVDFTLSLLRQTKQKKVSTEKLNFKNRTSESFPPRTQMEKKKISNSFAFSWGCYASIYASRCTSWHFRATPTSVGVKLSHAIGDRFSYLFVYFLNVRLRSPPPFTPVIATNGRMMPVNVGHALVNSSQTVLFCFFLRKVDFDSTRVL